MDSWRRTRLRSDIATSDVLLFPGRWEEPWGLVPLEAMACGCPVVATGRGGSREYLEDGYNCLLVPGQPEALARAVRRLSDDPALRERLRAGGLATAPRYTEDAFNRSVEWHLKDVLGHSQAPTRPAAPAHVAAR